LLSVARCKNRIVRLLINGSAIAAYARLWLFKLNENFTGLRDKK